MDKTTVNLPLQKKYSLIIPCAGLGNRMKGMGAKCLIEVNGKTLLERQIEAVGNAIRSFETVLVGGFEIESIKQAIKQRKNLHILENSNFETTNVAESIRIGLESAKHNDVIIIHGDLIFNKNALMAPFGAESCLIMDRESGGLMKKQEVGLVCYQHKITNLMYGLPRKWAQIAYLTGKELVLAKEALKLEESKKWFGFELLNKIIDNEGTFNGYCPKNIRITDLDSPSEIRAAMDTKW